MDSVGRLNDFVTRATPQPPPASPGGSAAAWSSRGCRPAAAQSRSAAGRAPTRSGGSSAPRKGAGRAAAALLPRWSAAAGSCS
eukprot:1480091-Prymnesium_polylepis.2